MEFNSGFKGLICAGLLFIWSLQHHKWFHFPLW